MAWSRGDGPIVAIKMSQFSSPMDLVKAAQEVIRSLPNGYVIDCNGKPVDNYYVFSALEYSCRIMANPWHNYPTKRETVETILLETGVMIYLQGYQNPQPRDLFSQWGSEQFA